MQENHFTRSIIKTSKKLQSQILTRIIKIKIFRTIKQIYIIYFKTSKKY